MVLLAFVAQTLAIERNRARSNNRAGVKPERTLQALYLDPLRERVQRNGGRVFANGPEFTLLIDLKQNWQVIYPQLRSVLTNYADMLTTFRNGVRQPGAVTVIITGRRRSTAPSSTASTRSGVASS